MVCGRQGLCQATAIDRASHGIEGAARAFKSGDTMRVSVVVASHNEGELLAKTIRSCIETTDDLDREIIVADDASSDGSIQAIQRAFPEVRVVMFPKRRGCSATKDLGARRARGDVLVFLDGHCKPERWAIERLVNDVEEAEGRAVVTPRIPALDCDTWENSWRVVGFGYRMDLLELSCGWVSLSDMHPRGALYENPALIGCCLAVSRDFYTELRGFDKDMVDWGVEDLDMGLRAWLVGDGILLNPRAAIGHRFRASFDTFSVSEEAIPVNQLRLARKNFTDRVWDDWCQNHRGRLSGEAWQKAWRRFSENRESVEADRDYLLANRARDEFWYAEHFNLEWPRSDRSG